MNIDIQLVINVFLGLIAFLGGWVLNNITKALDRLDHEFREMPFNYIAKTDYHRDIDEIKSICKQIFDKLDAKADK
jgi:hypothetical protein